MRTLRRFFSRFWNLTMLRHDDERLHEEIAGHIALQTEENLRAGLQPAEARRQALLKFGGVESVKESYRAARSLPGIEALFEDLRFAVRMLRKAPGFTAVAVLTLALGIGANTAIFSIVDAVLVRPFSYPHANQLVLLFDAPLKQPEALTAFSYRDFKALREQNHAFSEIAGNAFHDLTLSGAGEASVVNTADVTPGIFSMLGVKPLEGRTLVSEDGKRGAAPVAVVSESLWRSRFGANPNLVGKSITLDMRSFRIVGILPASFRYPDGAAHQDVWIPIAQDPLFGPLLSRPGVPVMGVIGRLKSDVSLAQARTEVRTLSARFAKEFPAQDKGLTIRLLPYHQFVVGNLKPALLILLGAVGLVLLIACANVSNLLLSRAISRGREIALRRALGASHGRIVRQLLTESALLGLLGGSAGVLLAVWGVWSLQSLLPADLTRIGAIHVGAPVLVFALVLSLSASLTFGLAPALLATASNLQANIQEDGPHAGRRRGQLMRSFLTVAEISLAVVLLIGGGLLLRSFAVVTSVNPGFDPRNLIRAEVSLPQFQYSKPQQWVSFANELLARLHAQPGLQDSALGAPLPMDRQGEASFPFTIAGNPPLPPGKTHAADYATVSPEYFHVMRIPLLRGRFFTQEDLSSNPNVAIISETLAERYFPNQDPLGRQMRFGFPPNGNVLREIVGIVGDVRDTALSQKPGPIMYVPFAQAPLYGAEVVVRSSLSASSVAAGIRQAVQSIDKNLPVTDIERFPDALDASISRQRLWTSLLDAFSAIALILAGVGIFGVVSYAASQRTREIGIRMALGAQPRDVLRLILTQGAKLALLGLGFGIVAALALTRLMTSMLYGVSSADPVTFASVAILLVAVAMLAGYIPARRTMGIDPMIALRYE